MAAGVFAAYGALGVCVGILAAVLHPLGVDANDLTTDDWKRLGLGAGVVLAVALLGSYAFGGYTAGRMARRAGLRHGVLVFAIGVAVLVVVAGIAQLEQATSAVRDRLESLGAPTGTSTWLGVGSLTGVIALVGMLVGSLLGGVRGERWHQRLVARALDPDVGPDADLADEADIGRQSDLLVAAVDGLDRLVVGRHPFTHQTKRCWKAVDNIDCADQIRLLQQRVGGVKAGWTRADYRHAQRARFSS